MKSAIFTSLLLVTALFAFGRPQSPVFQSEGEKFPSETLSWFVYQQMDELLGKSGAALPPSTNPYLNLDLPVEGYTNQGFPIFDMREMDSTWLQAQPFFQPSLEFWHPTQIIPFTTAQFNGGELIASLHELVGNDRLETQWVLCADLVIQNGTGEEVLHLQSADGGFHLPDWSADERFAAVSYGAGRDEQNGMRIYDLETQTMIADLPAPAHYMVSAPTFRGNRAYVTLDSWYSKEVVILAWDAETGGVGYAAFTPEEFSYFADFTPKGVAFMDCDGETAVIGLDFVRLEASL